MPESPELFAFDTGYSLQSGLALAYYCDKVLQGATLYRSKKQILAHRIRDLWDQATTDILAISQYPDEDPTVYVEIPQVYPGSALEHGKTEDLLMLATSGGPGLMLSPYSNMVRPRQWKGQLPKEVCGRRIVSTLSPEELETVAESMAEVAPSLQHNVWDAIGIGLWGCGRLQLR